eukprot:m51a1_g4635 hypothetical protein (278) ;mRNA; r:331525-332830
MANDCIAMPAASGLAYAGAFAFSDETESLRSPTVLVSKSRLYPSKFATVTIAIGSQWMAARGVRDEDVYAAADKALAYPESSRTTALGHCSACRESARQHRVVRLAASATAAAPAFPRAGLRLFVFDECRSYCSSSRTHLGGRVVIGVEIRGASGSVVARAFSEALSLCASPRERNEVLRTNGSRIVVPRPVRIAAPHSIYRNGEEDCTLLCNYERNKLTSSTPELEEGGSPAEEPEQSAKDAVVQMVLEELRRLEQAELMQLHLIQELRRRVLGDY